MFNRLVSGVHSSLFKIQTSASQWDSNICLAVGDASVNRVTLILILGVSFAFGAYADGACESSLCGLVRKNGSVSVRKFYAPGGYSFAWLQGGAPTSQAKALIGEFEAADARGLNPEDYDGSRWEARLARLKPGPNSSKTTEVILAEFDVALTVSAVRYMLDLHFGRANPGVFHNAGGDYEELADPALFLRQRLVNSSDVNAVLRGLEPPYPGYSRTGQALQRYLAMARGSSLPRLPVTAKTIEPGAAYPAAAQLAAVLQRLGDLTAWTGSSAYDPALVAAVKHFQTRHGLAADGRLGRATVAQLNTPLSRRILQLRLTLARWRWVPHSFARPPIVVNIPEFRLRALNASYQTELEMKVVVGSAYGGHETPVFAADMKYVVFRPYWDVPVSIARAELAPKIEKDPEYLTKNRYEVVDSRGKGIDEDPSDQAILTEIRSGELRIRQIPGPENALGLVKFLFPNDYDVYLHSTPATELFSKTRRDFSHGCIRVEDPEGLALWVLRNQQPEWTSERIHNAMNGEDTMEVTLQAPIPVLIVYATAVVLSNGEVRFFDDIYKQDARLEKSLLVRRSAL
jgi:murein L,D-transpeptidase YcbB/YkuD